MEPGQAPARGRIAIAIGAAVVLVAIVTVVAAGGGGNDERSAGPPPPGCMRAWNSDPAAVAFGRHNFNGHGYETALVTYLTDAGEVVASRELGRCAVVFPSRVLDPEAIAAGEVLKGNWFPISQLERVTLTRVAELQATAAGDPNTRLDATGELSAL